MAAGFVSLASSVGAEALLATEESTVAVDNFVGNRFPARAEPRKCWRRDRLLKV